MIDTSLASCIPRFGIDAAILVVLLLGEDVGRGKRLTPACRRAARPVSFLGRRACVEGGASSSPSVYVGIRFRAVPDLVPSCLHNITAL